MAGLSAAAVLERGYALGTLATAALVEHDDPDEDDVEPDPPEPGGDDAPMPTPTEEHL